MASEISNWIAAVEDQEKEILDKIRGVEHYSVECLSDNDKFEAVSSVLRKTSCRSTIFCQTHETAKWLVQKLTENGHSAALRHEESRDNETKGTCNSRKMSDNNALIVVGSMVRDVDLHNVTDIINYDLPINIFDEADCEAYLRRLECGDTSEKNRRVINLVCGMKSAYMMNTIKEKCQLPLISLKKCDM